VTPTGASHDTLTLACSGAPAHSTCTINPVSLAVAHGATGSATMTISTDATLATNGFPLRQALQAAFALLLPVLAFGRRGRRTFALLALCLALALTPTACGVHASAGSSAVAGVGGAGQTPPGSYPITVTAAFPGAQRTATFTLVVQ
jgi:hypothetical protein